jgi:hypothetical protein
MVKNKLFYFGAYEGFRQSFADTFLTTVPTMAQRQGQFGALNIVDPSTNTPFAGNVIPAARMDALARRVIDLYPEPNTPGQFQNGRPVNNYSLQRDGNENTHKFDTRFDYNLNEPEPDHGPVQLPAAEVQPGRDLPGLGRWRGQPGRAVQREPQPWRWRGRRRFRRGS